MPAVCNATNVCERDVPGKYQHFLCNTIRIPVSLIIVQLGITVMGLEDVDSIFKRWLYLNPIRNKLHSTLSMLFSGAVNKTLPETVVRRIYECTEIFKVH